MLTPFPYAGSKRRELSFLSNYIPMGSSIFEPFMGTAIVSGTFASRFAACDTQEEIAVFWLMAKHHYVFLAEQLTILMDERNRNEKFFYERREEYNDLWRNDVHNSRRSILFYFLVSACHASIPRFSKNGFNAPYKLQLGFKTFNIAGRLQSIRTIASKVDFVSSNSALTFLSSGESISDYDVIFADPPYVNGSFGYGTKEWTRDDLFELDELLHWQSKHGKLCLMTNYLDRELVDRTKADEIINKQNHRKSWRENFVSEDVLLVYGKRGLDVF